MSGISNRPEPSLLPTRDKQLNYTAIYPRQRSDFNIIHVQSIEPVGSVFSATYPPLSRFSSNDQRFNQCAAMGRHVSNYSTDSNEEERDNGSCYPHPRIRKEKSHKTTRPLLSSDENDS